MQSDIRNFFIILALLLVVTCSTSETRIDFIHIPGVLDNEDEILLFNGINENRESILLLDDNFIIVAAKRVEDIKKELKAGLPMSHNGYGEAYFYLDSLGINSIGENLAYAYTTPESVINAFILSESHYRNMTLEKWQYVGVAIGEDEEG